MYPRNNFLRAGYRTRDWLNSVSFRLSKSDDLSKPLVFKSMHSYKVDNFIFKFVSISTLPVVTAASISPVLLASPWNDVPETYTVVKVASDQTGLAFVISRGI